MQKVLNTGTQLPVRRSALTLAIAAAMLAPCAANATVSIHGVVAGSYFTAPVISDSPSTATASSTVASVYQNAKICFDLNNNGACDNGEPNTTSKSDGSFLLTSMTAGPLAVEVSTSATNNGHAVAARTVFRAAQAQISAATIAPGIPANIVVSPLTTEIVRSVENDGLTYAQAKQALAERLLGTSVSSTDANMVIANPATITNSADKAAILAEHNILTNRFTLAAKFVDRGDENLTAAELGANPSATAAAMTIPQAQEAAMNIEGIPRYDHIFVIMLENKATLSIKGSAWAPNINNYLSGGNQFVSYFATGNPSEPNYTALGGADDWGITDDNQWNCGATGANALQDTVIPTSSVSGLGSSPFTNPCSQTTNHNIVSRANLFNALSSNGLTWRTYSESMNPGQDFRTDSVGDTTISVADHVYDGSTAAKTLPSGATNFGNQYLSLQLPAQLYRTKHHPGMAYQNVRSAPEFNTSNRTLGGGQWDSVLLSSTKYTVPSGYNIDQFSTDLASGDIGNLNFVVPDQCDDMHGITVTGTSTGGGSTTASDCSSVANNVATATGGNIIKRGDNYTQTIISKIQASPVWTNPNKRTAIVIMFDEGNANSGYNSCCGWNPGTQTVSKPLLISNTGVVSDDTSVTNYYLGNRGHGESIFGVLNNHMSSTAAAGTGTAPTGLVDSDAYSHFSFVRTLQDMFGLADPDVDSTYMNRSKYTESFIAANISNLPEFAGSADTHFDSVRPMNHAYVIPSTYTEKQSSDVTGTAQTGPDATQTNLWSLK